MYQRDNNPIKEQKTAQDYQQVINTARNAAPGSRYILKTQLPK